MSDKNTILEAINQTLGEVNELLTKSGYNMAKAEPEQEDSLKEQGSPEQEGQEAPTQEGQEAPAQEAPAAPEQEGQEAPAQEGQEGQESPEDMASEAKALSDEDLDKLLEVLMAEKEGRHAPEQQAPAAPAAPAPAAPNKLEMSMKEEFRKLSKSMSDEIASLKKEVESVKGQKATSKIISKPVVTNKQQVLEKSAPVKQRLNKSESLTFLEGELRKGNKSVTSLLVAEMNLAKTQEEVNSIQDGLVPQGIQFPTR